MLSYRILTQQQYVDGVVDVIIIVNRKAIDRVFVEEADISAATRRALQAAQFLPSI